MTVQVKIRTPPLTPHGQGFNSSPQCIVESIARSRIVSRSAGSAPWAAGALQTLGSATDFPVLPFVSFSVFRGSPILLPRMKHALLFLLLMLASAQAAEPLRMVIIGDST